MISYTWVKQFSSHKPTALKQLIFGLTWLHPLLTTFFWQNFLVLSYYFCVCHRIVFPIAWRNESFFFTYVFNVTNPRSEQIIDSVKRWKSKYFLNECRWVVMVKDILCWFSLGYCLQIKSNFFLSFCWCCWHFEAEIFYVQLNVRHLAIPFQHLFIALIL